MSDLYVLVTYASEHGSTREIAEHIVERIKAKGPLAKCVDMATVKEPEEYSAVVVGSAVHGAKWLPSTTSFLSANAKKLKDAKTPVYAFSVGAPGALPKFLRHKWEIEEMKQIGDDLAKEGLDVKEHKLFSGKFTNKDAGGVLRVILTCCGGSFGDFRDWNAIEGWADKIADEIANSTPSTPARNGDTV